MESCKLRQKPVEEKYSEDSPAATVGLREIQDTLKTIQEMQKNDDSDISLEMGEQQLATEGAAAGEVL